VLEIRPVVELRRGSSSQLKVTEPMSSSLRR
jgi:hypothetical protein